MKHRSFNRMLSALLALALILAFVPRLSLTAMAAEASGSCGENLTWSFDEASGVLTVEGNGEMDYSDGSDPLPSPPWQDYDDGITRVRLPEGLTNIAPSAFAGCHALSQITIPDTVTTIGDYAFYSCFSLAAIEIPDSVTEIGSHVFEECGRLVSVKLPKQVASFGVRVFYYCGSLERVTVPEGVEAVGLYSFFHCKNLERVSLPNSLNIIGEHAFDGCTKLSEITIPEQTSIIDNYAFENCAGLTSVILPAGLQRVGYRAFAECVNLTDIAILSRECDLYDALYTIGMPYKTTVRGDAVSTARDYANQYGYPFKAIDTEHWFADVDSGAYYAGPVTWAVDRGITNGTAPYLFSPDSTCTRVQAVTFLWRAHGSPEPASSVNPFVDVSPDQYYYKAVLWAVEQGVTNGVDATHFAPGSGCTRAQVVTFLWRAMGRPAPTSAGNPFTDVDMDEYCGQAVLWAVENGVTTGATPTAFRPNATCTRGQIVTFLYRAEHPAGIV